MKINTLIYVVLICFVLIGFAHSEYYYSDGRQINLNEDSTKLLILFDDMTYNIDLFAANYLRIDSVMYESSYDDFNIAFVNDYDNIDEFIDTLMLDTRVDLVNPYFLNSADSAKLVG